MSSPGQARTEEQLGSIAETQEVQDVCAAHNLVAYFEIISIGDTDDAHRRVEKSAVKFRFVIDIPALKPA